MIKAILIGRHLPELGDDAELVLAEPSPRNLTFAANTEACMPMLHSLFAEAERLGVAIVFQALPAQVAVALFRFGARLPVKVGVIINTPGPRPASASHRFEALPVQSLVAGLRFVNPNTRLIADADGVFVTVDPPMKFVFSHIEWLNK